MQNLFLLPILMFSCSNPSENKVQEDSATKTEETSQQCPEGAYPGLLQVWRERNDEEESDYLVDPEPHCEEAFDIILESNGDIYSIGDCTTTNGQNSRTLQFEFTGKRDGPTSYSGEVEFTKPNGESQQDFFNGTCSDDNEEISLSIEWYMTVSTPNGEIEHHGRLSSPVPEND